MAANTASAGSGGSRGIAGGRDRVRKSLYTAAESSLGRGIPCDFAIDRSLKLLLQCQAIAWDRNTIRQDSSEFCRHDQPHDGRHGLK